MDDDREFDFSRRDFDRLVALARSAGLINPQADFTDGMWVIWHDAEVIRSEDGRVRGRVRGCKTWTFYRNMIDELTRTALVINGRL